MKNLPQLVGLAGVCLLLGGCVAMEMASGAPGDDLPALVKPGTDRAVVEKALYAPLRTWQPNAEVSYGLYSYSSTGKGSLGMGALMATLDVCTLGAFEIALKEDKHEDPRARARGMGTAGPSHLIWIGFDHEGKVCGHYHEFDILPEHPALAAATPGGKP
jgi:hypothetical protein